MQKKLILFGMILLSLLCVSLGALDLDSAELRRVLSSGDLEFVNYEGPYDVINSVEQIRGIGRYLSQGITQSLGGTSADYYFKYRILRLIDSNAPDKLSADLYIIEDKAQVDSITNIRRMLSAYLESAFSYSQEDAWLLAKLITIYNAIYRGDMDNVKRHYVSAVVEQVSKDNVGLARVYSQWAGKTRMLIPLRASVDGNPASLVDVNALTTEQLMDTLIATESNPADLVKQVADQKDRTNQEQQKNVTELVDLLQVREKEMKDKSSALELERSQAEKGESERNIEEIERDMDKLKEEASGLEQDRQKAQKAQEKLRENEIKADETRQQTQELLRESQTPVKEAKESSGESNSQNQKDSRGQVGRQGEQVNKKPTEAQEKPVDRKNSDKQQPQSGIKKEAKADVGEKDSKGLNREIQSTKDDKKQGFLDKDSNTLSSADQANSEVVAKVGNLIYFTRIIDGPRGVGQALLVDGTNKKILAQSDDLNVMRGSSILKGDELIVVTLEKDGARLKALDSQTLKEKTQALYLVHARTSIATNEDGIYLVVEKDKGWYLARFGKELTVGEVLSRQTVMPYSEIRFEKGSLFIESEGGELLKLNPLTLEDK